MPSPSIKTVIMRSTQPAERPITLLLKNISPTKITRYGHPPTGSMGNRTLPPKESR